MLPQEREGIKPMAPNEVAEFYSTLKARIAQVIVGQEAVIEQVVIALLAEGHVLIVGVPGLAKTLLVSTVAQVLGLKFSRIQFTPDLMPSDITGATIVAEDPRSGRRAMKFLPGPVFANIVLADEINRTPPKTQAALMEAMEERQVTQGGQRRPLDRPFFVLATQNPIEQEGTYPLPVSQLDRFLFNIQISYPDMPEEYDIMNRTTSAYAPPPAACLDPSAVQACIDAVKVLPVSDELTQLANHMVRSTRPDAPEALPMIKEYLSWGAGPRATQALLTAAKARAALHGRGQVARDDLMALFMPVMRHRLVLSYYAQADRMDAAEVLGQVLAAF